MFSRGALISLAFVMAVTATPLRTARATPEDTSKSRVAVLPPHYAGNLENHWRKQLEDRLLEGLARGTFEIVAPDELAAMQFDESCNTPACYVQVRAKTRVQYVIRTTIVRQERDYEVRIEVVNPSDASVAASTAEHCSLCGVAEVGELAAAQAAVLSGKLDELVLGPPILIVNSDPSGAIVYVDGEVVGVTPLKRVLTAGPHVVKTVKERYVSQEQTIGALSGVQVNMSFELTPLPSRWRAKARGWGWALLTGGAAALVSGVVLLAIDERSYRGRCSGADSDSEGDCRFLYDTMAGGIAATVVGTVVSGTGLGLLIAGQKAPRARPRTKLSRSRAPGTGLLGGGL